MARNYRRFKELIDRICDEKNYNVKYLLYRKLCFELYRSENIQYRNEILRDVNLIRLGFDMAGMVSKVLEIGVTYEDKILAVDKTKAEAIMEEYGFTT